MALHSNKLRFYRDMRLQRSHTVCLTSQESAFSRTCVNLGTVAAFCIAIITAAAGQNCSAQPLPSAPEAHIISSQSLEVNLHIAGAVESYSNSPGASPAPAYTAVYGAVRSVPHPRIADSKLFLMNGLHLGMAVLDVELTQHCIASHECREGNPLMPSSQTGQLSIGIGFVTLGSITSYWLKKHKSPYWWLPPAGGIAGHALGVATGLSH
jgi:hypothetical protein